MRRDAFQAIADPTRRQILGIIANDIININALASNFTLSRTAVYKHVKILTECGLVSIHQQGRERYCQARMENLYTVYHWLAEYSGLCDAQLTVMADYVSLLIASQKDVHLQTTTVHKRAKRMAKKSSAR